MGFNGEIPATHSNPCDRCSHIKRLWLPFRRPAVSVPRISWTQPFMIPVSICVWTDLKNMGVTSCHISKSSQHWNTASISEISIYPPSHHVSLFIHVSSIHLHSSHSSFHLGTDGSRAPGPPRWWNRCVMKSKGAVSPMGPQHIPVVVPTYPYYTPRKMLKDLLTAIQGR